MRKSASISLILIAFVIISLVGMVSAQSLTPSPTGSWTLTGAMSQARSGAAAVAISSGAVLVTGGTDANGAVLATTELYGANGSFALVAPMNVARTGHTATWIADPSGGSGGYVLVTGGSSSGGVILASAELYDPNANTWTLLAAPMVVARTGHPATALPNSSVLLSGGTSGNQVVLADIEQFGFIGQQFAFAGALPTARKAHAAAALHDGRVLIVGGTDANGNTLASTAIYDSVAGTISSGPSLNTPRANATATTLLDGTVLIAGGSYPEGAAANGNVAELQSAEIFDPVAGTITPTTSKMMQARSGQQAFLLPNNNTVLLVGGTYNGSDLASAELYTPWTGAFTATGTMSTPRSSASGAALFPMADGQLLVAGGNNQQTDATGAVSKTTSGTGELYGFATLKTDAPDYSPGTPVIMTGTGWKPSETVSLYMVATPSTADTNPVQTTAADSGGNIMYGAWAPDITDINARFYVTAVGATSGAQAQNTFTDSWSVSTSVVTVMNSGCTTAQNSFSSGSTVCGNVVTTATRNGNNNSVTIYLNWYNPSGSLAYSDGDVISSTTDTTPYTHTISTAGTWTVKVCSLTSSSCGTVYSSATFNVYGTASKLAIIQQPGTTTAGSAISPAVTVQVQDSNGDLVANNTSNVAISISSGGTFQSGSTLTVAAVGGVATFSNLIPTTAGSFTLSATDGTLTGATSSSFTVNVGAASKLAFSQQPSNTISGATMSPAVTVSVQDASGNAVTSDSGRTVTLTISSGGHLTNGTTTTSTATTASGVATFSSLVPTTFGSYTFIGSATGLTSTPASSSFNVTASKLAVSGFPSPVVSGVANNVTVTAQDSLGNTATNYTGTVQITSSDGQAVLPANSTLTSGTKSFSVTLKTGGTQTITATDTVTSTITGSQTGITVNQPPTITSLNNTTFMAGSAGTFTFTASGYPATMTYSETGTLPSGVTLSAAGVLSGTTTTAGSFPITVTASNGITPNGTQSFTLTVNQAPTITSANNTTFTTGSAGSFTFTASGYPASSFTETGTLPSGVTLSTAGVLSGTPAAGTGGSYPIAVTANNGVTPNATQNFTLTVNQAPAITSAANTTFVAGTAGSFTVTATGYPAPTFTETGTLPSGVTLSSAGVLSGTATTAGSFPITITASNGVGSNATQSFTLTVNQAPTITSANNTAFTVGTAGSFTVAASGYPTAMTYNETGTLPSGVTLSTAGVLSGTPAAGTGGSYPITITASNGVSPAGTQSFTLTVKQAPAITSAANTTFTVNTAGTFTVTATGNPAPTFSETGTLPTGVTLNPTTGVLSGTATTTGSYPITITASNGVGTNATQSFTLTIGQAPAITSANNTAFTINTAGSFTVTATGFPAPTFTETGTLPSGVTLSTAGVLSGTPTATGSFPITITAANGVGTNATQSFTLTVNQAPSITSANNTTFTTGTAGSFTFAASGYPTAMTYSETGALPSGVTLSTAGVLSGTPAAGTGNSYPITVTASNGVTPNGTQSFTLTVNQAPAFTSGTSTTFTVGTAGSFTAIATGYPAPTFTETGTLPSGVTLSTAGVLSGTPAAGTGGSYPITIKATNAAGAPTQSFTLTVNQAPAITSGTSTSFVIGTAGTFTVTATGYPAATLSESGTLPSGVTFNTSTGVLSGTPAAGTSGSYPITFTAANGVGSNATQNFTLTVNQAPAFTSGTSTTFTVGTAGTFTVTASGSPAPTITTSSTLPSGVTFTSATGVLAGTPATGSGKVYSITFTASNGVGTAATQTFTLTVNEKPSITSAIGTTFTAGSAGSFPVTASGYPAPTFTESGTLPSGVTLNSTSGVLSGTPAAGTGGSYPITITATNSQGTGTQGFTLTVNQSVVITTQPASPTVVAGQNVTLTAAATGYPLSVQWQTCATDWYSLCLSGWSNINGATSTSYTFVNPTTTGGTGGIGVSNQYYYQAVFTNGAGSNATSNTATVTVNADGTATALSSSLNPSNSGQSVTFTATVTANAPSTGIPTGTVTFKDGTTTLGTGTLNGSGAATYSTTALAVGTHSITAAYGADSNYNASTSTALTQTVYLPPTITSGASTTFTVGTAGSFTVTASGSPAPTFTESGALPSGVTLSSAGALAGSPATAGTYQITITATNPGGTNNQTFTLTVNKGTPTVSTWPTASQISYGQTLASSTLSGGSASVGGGFAFTTPGTTPGLGTASQPVTFTPTDTADWNTVSGSVSVTVIKATPTITTLPTASPITYGQTLASSSLTGGAASVAGSFTFTTPSTVPGAGTYSASITFTPTNSTDYNPTTGNVNVTVNKATPTVNTWPTASPITYGSPLSSSNLTGGSTTPSGGSFSFTNPGTVPGAGTAAQSVTYTPADTTDYNTVPGTVSVTVTKAAPTVNTWPTASAITYGQTLASSTLSGGSASVGGGFAFTTPSTAPGAGTAAQSVTFTPADATDYSAVTGTVSVTVSKAGATVTLGGLSQTYTGAAESATATTNPTGLTVTFTYNGSPTVPTVAGNYTVVGTINDSNYQGSATSTMTISQALATVTLGNLTQTYNGHPEAPSVSTSPTGLVVVPSYTGISTSYGPTPDAPTNPGTYTITASIVDPNYTGFATNTLTINQLSPALSLALLAGMPEPSPYGTMVYFELSMGTTPCPTGTVQFNVDGNVAPMVTLTGTNCTNPVQYQTATLTPGPHSVYAVYSGDTFYQGATSSTVSHAVTADTVAVTLGTSGGTVNVGQTVTFTAVVTPTALDPSAHAPAGTVQFSDNGNQIGSSPLGTTAPYTATYQTSALAAGSHSITATYVNTDGLFVGSSSPVTVETVNKIAPAIAWTNPADIAYGTKLDATQLNATATDSITNNPITGTWAYSPVAGTVLAVGPRTLGVTFTPDDPATYTTQTATVSINVTAATLTVTPDSLSKSYGTDNPALTYQITGFVNNEDVSVVSGTPALATTATASSVVGSYPITASVGSLLAANYTFTYASGTLAVTPATLTVKADDAARAYGVANPTFTGSLTGLVTGDNITATFASTATTSSAVGTYPITGTLVDPGNALGNYTVTSTPGTLTITPASVTVTADAKTKVYGTTDPAFTYHSSGLLNGDRWSGSLARAGGEAVGPYAILQGTLGAGGNYTINYTPANLTITQASASVTPNAATKVYGTGDPAFTGTLTGFLPADNVAASYTRTTGENVAGSPYVISATLSPGGVLGNYNITYNTAQFTITQALATVTLSGLSQTYDGTPKAASVSTSPTGLFVTPSYTGVSTSYGPVAAPPTNPGTYSITATVVDANYTGMATDTLTINQLDPALSLALLSGMPDQTSYGTMVYYELGMGTTPCPTGQVQFMVDGNPATTVTLAGSNCNSPVEFKTATLAPGGHTVKAVYSGDTFYVGANSGEVAHTVVADATAVTLATTGQTINVGYPVTFTATVIPSATDPSAQALTGNVQFLDSGVQIGASPVALVGSSYTAAFTTSALAAGSHSIMATYVNADGLYAGNSSTVTVESVNKIAPAIAWANPADVIYGTKLDNTQLNAAATDSITNQPISGTYTYNPVAGTVLAVGSRTMSVTFTPDDAATYTTQTATVTINVTAATLTVAADNTSRVYGTDNPTFTYQITGFVNGEDASLVTGQPALGTAAVATSPVNKYPITVDIGTLVAPNYNIAYTKGTLTVTPATLTVKADDATRTYGAANPMFTGSLTGLVTGDNITATFATTATAASGVGGYPITGTLVDPGNALGNYTVSYTNGTLTITQAALTIGVQPATKVYGTANPVFAPTYSGFVNNDTPAVLIGTLSYSTAAGAVGSYPVTPSGVTATNYSISFTPGTILVTSAGLTVIVDSYSRGYGASNPTFTGTLTGVANGDNISATYGSTATASSGTGKYAITVTLVDPGNKLGNYNVTETPGTLTITAVTVAVGVQPATKVYGAPNPTFTPTYSGFVNGDSAAMLTTPVTFTTSATTASGIGSYPVTPSGAVSANYSFTYTAGTLSVTPAVLTVTANNLGRVFGSPNPTLTYAITGYVNGDTAAVVSGAASCSTTATSSSPTGGYPITCTQGTLAAANYTFNMAAGTLGVSSPDLVERSVSVTGTAVTGGTMSVVETTLNQGNANAGVSYSYLYLSQDGVTQGPTLSYRYIAPLTVGAGSTATSSVTLPTNILGTYYVLACANGTNVVAESNTANNCTASASFNVTGADLVVNSASVTGTAASGGTINVTDTTANIAAGAAPASYTYFYLSTDKVTKGATLGYRYLGALGSGGTSTATTAVTLPTNTVGTYYVLACANGNNLVVESNTANDCMASAGFNVVGVADLVESSVTGPASGAAGGSISVTDTTTNQGGGAAAGSYTYFYLSTDGVTKGTTLGYRIVGALAAGASSTSTTKMTLPTNITGLYYVLVCANATNSIVEGNASNDCTASAQFNVAGADLIESSVTGPASGAAGGSISVSDTTTNQGGGSAPSSYTYFYLSTDGVTKGATLGYRIAGVLAANASSSAATTMNLPTNIKGTYYVMACANGSSSVVESNTANNCTASAAFTVAGADLIESSVTGPVSGVAGGTISVTDTTTNQGGGAAISSYTYFYLSTNGVTKGAMLTYRIVGVLAANASSSATTTMTLPKNISGTYYVLACANDNNAVLESNTSNNCTASGAFVITH